MEHKTTGFTHMIFPICYKEKPLLKTHSVLFKIYLSTEVDKPWPVGQIQVTNCVVNKTLLEHTTLICLPIVYGFLHSSKAKLSSFLTQAIGPTEPEIFTV